MLFVKSFVTFDWRWLSKSLGRSTCNIQHTGKRCIKVGTLSNVGTFPFVYSSVFRTYIISNVNINIVIVTMVVGPIQIHLNEDIKVFNKHQVSDHLYTLLLSMTSFRHLKTQPQCNYLPADNPTYISLHYSVCTHNLYYSITLISIILYSRLLWLM